MLQSSGQQKRSHLNKNLIFVGCSLSVIVISSWLVAIDCLADNPPSAASQPLSARAAFLRSLRASPRLQQPQQSQPAQQQQPQQQQQQQPQAPQQQPAAPTNNSNQTANQPIVASVSQQQQQQQQQQPAPPPLPPQPAPQQQQVSTTSSTTTTTKPRPIIREPEAPVRALSSPLATNTNTNRSTRTADIEEFNIFVTNTCERELMHVNIKTSKPFYGVIHTRNQRQKSVCTIEGTGETEYNLDIHHVLNQFDPNYCGVIKARKESPENKDLLSVVIAVRVHKNIELSNDKFFLLNCTNRCRRSDCSTSPNARLIDSNNLNARVVSDESANEGERESVTPPPSRSTPGAPNSDSKRAGQDDDECTIYKFPWVITLLWCLAILLLASIISHCIMCSSMVCRCVKTEVEEREPSVYEGETDDEDNLYNKKNHPMRIDYDNRDIYKTSNNYEPYCVNDDNQVKAKSRHSSSKRTARR
uniref:Cuticlin N-terminal domain-containing protein n=1 Tax=Aceria tosichella TaxID=561515 RepID=A0A6G1SJE2_9ACAR